MVTNDLGACEWFVWDLRRSGLVERGQLDTTVGEFLKRNPRAEAPALAEFLVHHGTLTPFQAERVLNGKTQGLILGPYVLQDAVGSGSMGQVYKAGSKNDSLLYAVKVLPRRSMWNVRLARRQVRSFGGFGHPAVVPFVDVGTAGGLHYLVWPLVEGTTLEGLIQQEGKLAHAVAALYAAQVAQGLNEAHENSLFHGLVKPSNVMVGADNQARILDFGIGCLLVENEGESLVDTMSTANTLTSGLDCASPESIMEPTNRTPAGDQYSLGCVLYYCLTGRVPFPEGSAVEKMMAHQLREPVPISELTPDVPEGLVAVVKKLMAKKPEERYAGCDEVVEALEPFVGDPRALSAGMAGSGSRPGLKPGSSGRMPGLGSSHGSKIVFPNPQPPMATPAPAYSRPVPTPPPSRPDIPVPGRAAAHVPSRSTIQTPPRGEEAGFDTGALAGVQTPVESPWAARSAGRGAATNAVPAPPPSKLQPAPNPQPVEEADDVTTGWAEEVPDRAAAKGSFGPMGLVAVAVVLMAAVYFGAMMLMKQ